MQHVFVIGVVDVLHYNRNLSVKAVLTQPIDATGCSVVILAENQHFSLVWEVSRNSFGVDSFWYFLRVTKLNYTQSLVDSKNRQIMVRWSILQTSWFYIERTSMMWTHKLVIKTDCILHCIRFFFITFTYLILSRALSTNSIQFSVVPNN